jgi:hypothetical protein
MAHHSLYHHYSLHNVGALIVGMLVGSCVNMAVITIQTQYWFPLPEGVTFSDTEEFSQYIGNLPTIAFAIVFLAHFGQAVVGGYVAAQLGTVHSIQFLTYSAATLTMFGSIVNNLSLTVPKWTWIEIPFYPLIGWYMGKYCAAVAAKQHKQHRSAAAAREKQVKIIQQQARQT